ncbi:NAD-dependent epimerase/dehydratase family protein [Vibrio splendidus]
MNILILGGTGAMGKSIVELLSEKKIEVTVTSRTNKDERTYVKYIKGDAQDLCFLTEVLDKKSWDSVIDFMVYSTETFKERIELLLGSTKQYIFISSARVYEGSDRGLLETSGRLVDTSSDSVFLETDQYPLTKARQEDILLTSKAKNWTIIRPYITYDNERLQLGVFEKEDWLYRALQGKKIVVPEEIMDKKTTMTSGWDVAKGIVSIINKQDAIGQSYHITNNKPIVWRDVLEIYLNTLEGVIGYRPEVTYQKLKEFYKYNSKYPIEYDRLFDRVFDNTKISKFIDVSEFVEPHNGIRHSTCEFLKGPHFKSINWKAEAFKDKESGDYTSLYKIQGLKNKLRYLVFRVVK